MNTLKRGLDSPGEQVPKKKHEFKYEYLLIGDGRLACHLAHYFSLTNTAFQRWSRRTGSEEELFRLAENSEKTLLAISDRAIAEYCEKLPGRKIHFSGCLTLDGVDSAHPLMTFSHELYDLEFYRQVPFVTERGKADFPRLFPQWSNPHYAIKAEDKVIYHALCVMSGNFTILLWHKYFTDMQEKLQLPLSALSPYMRAVYRNIEKDHSNALTGPLARGDREVIEKHLLALENDAFKPVYDGFVRTFQQLQETKT